MQFAESLSTQDNWNEAVEEVLAGVHADEGETTAAVVFFTSHHVDAAPRIAERLCDGLGTENLIGCSAAAVVGGGRECEDGPGLALWTASLPSTTVVPMHLQFEPQTDGGSFVGWPASLPPTLAAESALVLLGDPFSFPADRLLERLNDDQPGVAVAGGMASAAMQPGANRLIIGRRVEPAGAVAMWLEGGFQARTLVSQGCRPIGPRFVITKAHRNLIQELSGKPALAQLQALFPNLDEADQQLVREGLQLGRVMNEFQGEFARGDFLIRAVLAADEKNGAIGVGDLIRVGQTVQFHVRDAETAREDLVELTDRLAADAPGAPCGGLLFTCNGRGSRLFQQAGHDVGGLRRLWPELPVSGFFAAGEIGPVAGANFLHGFTASVLFFYE